MKVAAERREFARKKFSFAARIQDPVGGEPVVCLICDISGTGAYLRMAVADVPKRFTLLLSNDGRIRRQCRVAWQRGINVGVEFI